MLRDANLLYIKNKDENYLKKIKELLAGTRCIASSFFTWILIPEESTCI
ncbi:conserved hypothetical protein [Listeria marthii FSL S4-120]|uniref:Uncharacterized protein n=1 Tax=Listeria marthii FSL S4-120 TaxID=702457 RepID=A0ABP2K127_9LIST|nr:conserved hypothetical protein [Listeria marthii FSL S4-120]